MSDSCLVECDICHLLELVSEDQEELEEEWFWVYWIFEGNVTGVDILCKNCLEWKKNSSKYELDIVTKYTIENARSRWERKVGANE